MADEGTPLQRHGVGASIPRKEDDRHLRGRAQFVADIDMRGMQEVVFVRSTHAHAHVGSISVPPVARGKVFTASDLPRIKADPGGDAGRWRSLARKAGQPVIAQGRGRIVSREWLVNLVDPAGRMDSPDKMVSVVSTQGTAC